MSDRTLLAIASTITFFVSAVAGIALLLLGIPYFLDGSGLHPAIALTLSAAFLWCAVIAGEHLASLMYE